MLKKYSLKNKKLSMRLAMLVPAILLMSLASCVGGGGVAAPPAAAGVSTGGAATKGPLNCSVQGSVIATDSSAPAKTAAGSTPTVGSFTVDVTGMTYPVTVTMSGCKDTITGATQGFDLSTIVMSSSQTVTNATPISTLAVAAAKAAGGGTVTQAGLDAAVATVLNTFGLSASLSNPLTTSYTTAAEVTNMVMASEAISEVIKRLATAKGASTANVLQSLSADLATGALDGTAPAGVTPAVAITANSVGTQIATVLTEVSTGTLTVTPVNPRTGAAGTPLPATALTNAIAAFATITSGQAVVIVQADLAAVPTAQGAAAVAAAITTAVTNGTSITAAGRGASSFKLTSNTITATDFLTTGAPIVPSATAVGVVTGGVMTANIATPFNATNLSDLIAGANATAKAPAIAFGTSLPFGNGVATVTAELLDNPAGQVAANVGTHQSGERAVSVTFTVNWVSDGASLILTAPAGNATATFFTVANTTGTPVVVTLTNASANVLSAGAALNLPAGQTQVNAAIANLFNASGVISTALNAVQVSGSYAYKLTFTGFPLVDVNTNAFTVIQGAFSVQ